MTKRSDAEKGRGEVVLYDSSTGLPRRRIPCDYVSGVDAVAYSPDGVKLATSGRDRETGRYLIDLRDLPTGEARTLGDHLNDVVSLEFSPDGKWLASASGRGEDVVKVWDVEAGELRFTNGRQERRIAIGIGGPGDLAFSPDSKLLATCVSSNDPEYEGSVTELWEVATGERRHWWPSHLGTTVNFSPDGLWVVFYDDSATQLANPVTGQIEATLGGLSGADRLFELGWDSDCESAHRPAQQSETEVLGILGITPMVA